MRGTCFLLTAWMTVWAACAAHSRTFYVGKTNASDNNPGTRQQPWATIGKAASTLVAGDTVLIMAGVYREQVIARNSGAAGNYITYAANPGDSVTIDGTGVSLSGRGLFQITRKSYIRVQGLKLTRSPNYGLCAEGSNHIILRRNYVYNMPGSGIIATEFEGRNRQIVIDSNDVHLVCDGGAQECISVAKTDTFIVSNNHVHDGGSGANGGEGIDVKFGSNNGKIFGNYVHHLARQGIYVDAWTDRTYNIDVFNNIVHDCPNDGFDCASEQGGTLENITFYNNIAYNCRFNGFAFRVWGGTPGVRRNIKIINNTFYRNGYGGNWGPLGGIVVQGSGLEGVVIRNNIVSDNNQYQIYVQDQAVLANSVIDHNLIHGYRGFAGETRGTAYVEGVPGFVDASGADFHLAAGSPAIDKGSSTAAPSTDFDGVARPQSPGWDIGAFEFSSGFAVRIVADKTSGTMPLTVNFDGSGPAASDGILRQRGITPVAKDFDCRGVRVRCGSGASRVEFRIRKDGRVSHKVMVNRNNSYIVR